MLRSAMFVSAVWTASAAVAVGAGLAAISALGAGFSGRTVTPMNPAEVRAALAEPAPPSPKPSPTPTSSPSATRPPKSAKKHSPAPKHTQPSDQPSDVVKPPPPVTRNLSSEGGDVLARCERDSVYLVSWTPMQGFSASTTGRGPADAVLVDFVSSAGRITMAVTCHLGTPSAIVRTESRQHHHDDDHF